MQFERKMAKRPGGELSAPPAKRSFLGLGPLDIGPASGEEDLNVKVLQVRLLARL